MSEDKKNSRRKVLKVAAGAGLIAGTKAGWESDKWTKPVVETVLLPAHAQTSTVLNGTFAGSTNITTATLDPSGFDILIPTAHANGISIQADLCLVVEDNQVNAAAVVNGYTAWEGTGALDTAISLQALNKVKSACVLNNVTLKVNVKGTPPNQQAYGDLSFDFGCFNNLSLPSYSGSYDILETDLSCGEFSLTKNPTTDCNCN